MGGRLDPAVAAVRVAVRDALAGAPPGPVLVACSGGADSLALAACTAFVAPRAGRAAGAVVVDHGLQEGSAVRSAGLGDALRALGLAPVEVVAVTVGRAGGPEAAAREARYAALSAAAGRHGAAAVLLGHTLDDQAETVLLGLARGSGARSLAGMAAASGLWRRPLLGLPRATARAACAALGLHPWEDPHNADPAYARVRVRQDALPALEESLGPGVAAALARTARLLRDDADALDGWAERELPALTAADGSLDVVALEALPAAVRRRCLRAAALAAGCPATALFAVHVDALEALVVAWHGQGPVQLPGHVEARRRCGRLDLEAGQGNS
ncbi:tRNA lysidine(34) synthetase TilS [Motilibacter aurantiacus]|uniref:tRNA lysidine(34) synthetase TilS n=1 Tax=Motilibacter aurantiacus TaxID=2714955 RepID=UPI00140B09B7|nr:tRNA lysidine(34) synthetase TilS [Motilibacter aurantiacus]